MYAVEIDYKNFITGEEETIRLRSQYKTLLGAEKVAAMHNSACIPSSMNGERVSETRGRVVKV